MKRLALPALALLALGLAYAAPGGAARRRAASGAGKPVALSPPRISGTAQEGKQLSASTGSWSHSPSSYAYGWKRCNARGASCTGIAGAGASVYTVARADVGHALRVFVMARNSSGRSVVARSAPSGVVGAASGVQRLEYVFEDGLISVYSLDEAFKLLKTISLPQTDAGIRGVMVAPSTHMLFISYGSDYAEGGGSVLAYDLVTERVSWTVTLKTGIDSGAVSPDGKTIYMPTGENSPSGIWNILSGSTGALTGTIPGGAGAHDTVASQDGRYVYLGGRNYDYLGVYETATGKLRNVGPLKSGVRPFTVNGADTLAYTTATGLDGFQVSSLTSGKVLFTSEFGSVPSGFPYTAPSHGISLSPDEQQLYVIDSVNHEVHVYDVAHVGEGVAPTQLGVIPVSGLTGEEGTCAYDCGRSGWLQHSLDGRFVFVGDSGDVIETATRKVIAHLSTLANTKKFLEIDWRGGVPVASSGRLGVGLVP